MQLSVVHLVHCVDTEGPLYESLSDTFSRLNSAYGLKLQATEENLRLLQQCKIPLNGLEIQISKLISPRLLAFNPDWSAIDKLHDRIMSTTFRMSIPDSFGNGWLYSWHCMDHLDYIDNPRRKAVGIHQIFDYYQDRISKSDVKDKLHWHFHPSTIYREGHRSCTSYENSKFLHYIICRRILERNWLETHCHI